MLYNFVNLVFKISLLVTYFVYIFLPLREGQALMSVPSEFYYLIGHTPLSLPLK